MAGYTCNTCGVVFDTAVGQREHMKSDWHRYNLKRRVAGLPSIDEATFSEKVANARVEKEEEENKHKKDKVKQMTKKEMRRLEKEKLLAKKQQLLQLAKESMLKNMQDSTPVNKASDDPEVQVEAEQKDEVAKSKAEEIPEEEMTPDQLAEKLMAEKLHNRVEIPETECLFTGKKYKTFEENLDHMFRDHGFYIPEQKYLVDKSGLFKYFSEKIGLGNMCFCCSYQGRSLEAVRAHMLSKKHCRIPYETEAEKLEISEFYDFSSTYEELDKAVNEDESQWVDVDEDDDGDIENDKKEDDEEEEELPEHILYNDGVELHLPTGVKVGHRTLQRYYRQNLKPERELSEGQGTIVAADTRHFATIFDRQQQQVQKTTWQTEVKDKKRDDKRAAKFVNNQPHYRDQLLQ
ncbi:Rei1p [Kluyveromyces lactis]|uniref:KLLA0F01727p n=1 Tax=Kluyveromyces lactis (strain ATCC 8585 / CBS 2359 / DSM 70799 / NBRC 1267 / NRRL Y-1140 / WM37) TaxID=284590 RepID=Q6CLN1_KLULA|nr:uncharacterized protein KLLA0_F01727g [Kluyveromyces lactis]CAG97865.1 KLLA0F01727p [Kluyveromyces lactis]|eukprot:XP_455158.1 uncharacterized protein KLLA0_F01727g [Kluyveromyces lactis]